RMTDLTITPARVIVTGHDAQGRAVIVSDGPAKHLRRSPHRAGVPYQNIWTTDRTPALADGSVDPVSEAMALAPPPMGTNFRLVTFGPEADFPGRAGTAPRGVAEPV